MFRVAARVMGYTGAASSIGKHTVAEIRRAAALQVSSLMDLTKRVANITYHNPQHHMYFRGQKSDHYAGAAGTTLYPSIFRGNGLTAAVMEQRYARLKLAEDLLLQKTSKLTFTGKQKLSDFQELRWAILQHYEVCHTPVLDVTSSLRVAVSFALRKGTAGWLYVLGLPAVDSSITYSVEERMLNVQLARICPPRAYRPFFQEAFLVGDYPKVTKRSTTLDFARRLVTKFKLTPLAGQGQSFPRIDEDFLFPNDRDVFYGICEDIRKAIS